ncbi:putative T7SS-secreted protein [Amycolatopsis minnesotensis]|uniref:Putative T7SS secretion signal domain-containing protein n=1 Tax=Amycolatopsis minnesotensis TaxID=337894 RepID=A0ABN2RCG8_9PSEU
MSWARALDEAAPVESGLYPALGFDPAPGVVATVTGVATTLGKVATDIGIAHDDLTKLNRSDGFWEGDGAQAFKGTVGEVPDYLNKAHTSLADASRTLGKWAEDLGTMQRQAAEFEQQAAAAQSQVTRAQGNPNLKLAGQSFEDPAQLQEAENALGAAQQQVTKAQDDLDAIRGAAKRLREQHLDLAGQVAAALRRAKDEAPEEPGMLERIGNAIGKMVDGIKDLAGKAWQWVKDHADVIAKIGDVLSAVGTVLSVVAAATSWIPGVNAVTAAAAVGVSAAAAGTHLLAKAAGANVSWSTIAFDGLGMIPGAGAGKGALGAAKVLPKAVKAGRNAAKFAEEGSKMASGARAMGKTFSRAGSQQIGGGANLVNKGIDGVNKVAKFLGKEGEGIQNLTVNSWKPGGRSLATLGLTEKALHTAESGAAVAAGAAVVTGKQAVVTVGKWEAEPYVEQGREAVSQGVSKALGGRIR